MAFSFPLNWRSGIVTNVRNIWDDELSSIYEEYPGWELSCIIEHSDPNKVGTLFDAVKLFNGYDRTMERWDASYIGYRVKIFVPKQRRRTGGGSLW